MYIEFKDVGKYKIMQVNGEVDLYNISDFKKALFNITDGTTAGVAIDLKNVTFSDSSLIGALISGQKKMKALNGKFALLAIHQELLNILIESNLDKYFEIYNTEDELP